MKSMKDDEKAVDSPKLIMDRFLNGCHQRVWESSHESLSNVPPPHEQSSSKPSEQCAKQSTENLNLGANPVCSDSHQSSELHNSTAEHYTIPLQADVQSGQAAENYIPSGGSSGYGTCSDHYSNFESGSSVCMSTTNNYFKSRLADVAECNSLSTCGEEEEGQQTIVGVMKHSRDCPHHFTLESHMNSNSEITQCDIECPNRLSRSKFPVKSTCNPECGEIPTQCAGHINTSITCTSNDLNRQGSLSDHTPTSLPPEHYFTDDEGYLRFTKEAVV